MVVQLYLLVNEHGPYKVSEMLNVLTSINKDRKPSHFYC